MSKHDSKKRRTIVLSPAANKIRDFSSLARVFKEKFLLLFTR